MAVAFRSDTGPTAGGPGTTFDITEPTGCAQDDILLCAVYSDSAGGPRTITPPTGWNTTFNGTTLSLNATAEAWDGQLFWIRRGASAPSLTFTLSVSGSVAWQAVCYSGAATSGDPHSFGTKATRNDTTAATYPAVSGTTAQADEVVVWVGFNFNGGTTTAPSGFTGRKLTTGWDIQWADEVQVSAGATGSITSSWTGAANGTAGATLVSLFATAPVASVGYRLTMPGFKTLTMPGFNLTLMGGAPAAADPVRGRFVGNQAVQRPAVR